MELNKIYQGNSLEVLKTLPADSIDCCVTSPPYFGLRDYGTGKWVGGDDKCKHRRDTKNANPDWVIQTRGKVDNGVCDEIFRSTCPKCGAIREDDQIGLEETPEQYVAKLVMLFSKVRRVLKPEGTLWLNLGDSYAAYWDQHYGQGQSLSGSRENKGSAPPSKKSPVFSDSKIKPKDLFGIPWMVAFALRNDGWYLRQDIIWHKPNPMPESVTDRCTKSHEYIFLLSKSAKYYYDADSIKTQIKDATVQRMNQQIEDQKGSNRVPGKKMDMKAVGPGRNPRKGVDIKGGNQAAEKGIPAMGINGKGFEGHSGNFDPEGNLIGDGKANKKSVWTVTTKPFSEAHFATFPEDLIVDCIKAGTPPPWNSFRPIYGRRNHSTCSKKAEQEFYWHRAKSRIHKDCRKKINI